MDFNWLLIAFVFGFAVMRINIPPMVGYLLAGFALHALGVEGGVVLATLSKLGILLLLFSIGLKLSLRSLLRPYVWGTTTLHILITTLSFWGVLYIINLFIPLFENLTAAQFILAAFALSFSSTVFAVKVLDEKGEMASLHGKVAISVLIMQDIFAVLFITFSGGTLPETWSILLLLGLWPLRWILLKVLDSVGHGELLLLFGMVVAFGGAEFFAMAGLKPDLGALILGVLLAGHVKSSELSRDLMGFKDIFLIGFFLSIGLESNPELYHFFWALVLVLFALFKSALFFVLFTRFKLRARTATLTSLSLMNYSEFGLIVAAVGVSAGIFPKSFLTIIALSVAMSFIISAPVNIYSQSIYGRFRSWLKKFETASRLAEDQPLDTGNAEILIFGMGRVGSGAYNTMSTELSKKILGVDTDREKVNRQKEKGWNVLPGDATDADFWYKLPFDNICLILLTMPSHSENMLALRRIRENNYTGKVAVSAKYRDQMGELISNGADAAYNVYDEAGSGFAFHVIGQLSVEDSTN